MSNQDSARLSEITVQMDSIPEDVLIDIFVMAGAWQIAVTEDARETWISASSVCMAWRTSLMDPRGQHLARMLVNHHGPDEALNPLIRAAGCPPKIVRTASHRLSRRTFNSYDLIQTMLVFRNAVSPRVHCQAGMAMVSAAQAGNVAVIQLLASYEQNTPSLNELRGVALISAAENGHEGVMRLLLSWKGHQGDSERPFWWPHNKASQTSSG